MKPLEKNKLEYIGFSAHTETPEEKKKVPCKFFASGTCSAGSNCPYLHQK